MPEPTLTLAPLIPEHRRCSCTRSAFGDCHREATQEDLLCDVCRANCGERREAVLGA